MIVYVIRHAQSENNALAVATIENAQRASDPGLTPRGLEQCARLRERMTATTAAHGDDDARDVEVYSSPMRRCLMTTDAVARGLGVRFRVRGDLHEHGGCFRGARGGDATSTSTATSTPDVVGLPGMTKAEMERAFPRCDVPRELERGWWSPERGCESVRDAQERVRGVAEWLWARARAMLFCSQNACVHKLHFDVSDDGACVGLQTFNDVTHIPEQYRSGGSVEGLDVAYTKEGSA
jgi:broad specificity phosphatase PhoE